MSAHADMNVCCVRCRSYSNPGPSLLHCLLMLRCVCVCVCVGGVQVTAGRITVYYHCYTHMQQHRLHTHRLYTQTIYTPTISTYYHTHMQQHRRARAGAHTHWLSPME